MPMRSALVVDDDPAISKVLATLLKQHKLSVSCVASGEAALAALERRAYDVVLSDVRMPGIDGIALLRQTTARWPGVPVVMISAHGTIALAVEAMKLGAADFLTKPFDVDAVTFAVNKALAASAHHDDRPTALPTGNVASSSAAMREVEATIARVAPGTATVLLLGESGTGKEVAARKLHDASPRRLMPFVAVHCAALPEALLESELFGYEKGAFTGAAARKLGRVELAHGGTLFFDEIGEISPATQVKLLRLLQERTFERLGGTETVRADVRFIAATHRDLEAAVARGEFREDLYYRLAVVPLRLPALRERREDIGPLAQHFARTIGALNGKPSACFDDAAIALLEEQPWPGNVRQLQNFVERLIVLAPTAFLDGEHVARQLGPISSTAPSSAPPSPRGDAAHVVLGPRRRDAERDAIARALASSGGNRSKAARILGVSRSTLYNKLAELGLDDGSS